MAKKPVVDQETCIGCGLCSEICPGVFILNEENLAEVIDSLGGSEQDIQEAIDQCPVTCISWIEE